MIKPASSYLNADWFARYWNQIIADSGVDQGDDGNQIELILFTLNLLDDAAKQYMAQLSDTRAYAAYQVAMNNPNNATAENKVSLIIGWNPQTASLLEQKLEKFSGILVQAGRKFGYLRFFSTACHGQRRVYPQGRPICSVCKRPADF